VNKTPVFQPETGYYTDRAAQVQYSFTAGTHRLQIIVSLFELYVSFADVVVNIEVRRPTCFFLGGGGGGYNLKNTAQVVLCWYIFHTNFRKNL
jgi:hypothetical protein